MDKTFLVNTDTAESTKVYPYLAAHYILKWGLLQTFLTAWEY